MSDTESGPPTPDQPPAHGKGHPGWVHGADRWRLDWYRTTEHAPAWLRETTGEQRVPVSLAILLAIGLQVGLPDRFAFQPRYLLPSLEIALLAALVVANPTRFSRGSRGLRLMSLLMIAVMNVANGASIVLLVRLILRGAKITGAELLGSGLAIWATNVIVFALWYWELDRGGPYARRLGRVNRIDFLFPQMSDTRLGGENWEPTFPDYLYVSFTNATAFSPTDTMPLTRWTKMLMLAQSAVSLVTVALVAARAVNILQ